MTRVVVLDPLWPLEDADAILAQTEEAVRRFHDPSPGSMVRIAVAPCSPFSVTRRLLATSAALARRLAKGVLPAHGETKAEPLMDVAIVGQSVLYMANLPPEANVMFHTVMATKMPFAGRG